MGPHTEAPIVESLIALTLNIVGSTMSGVVHRLIYYHLHLSYFAMHVFHYLIPFLIITIAILIGIVPRQRIPLTVVAPLVATEALASLASCVIHMCGSDGTLNTIRMTDFAVSTLILRYSIKCVHINQKLIYFVIMCSFFVWMEENYCGGSTTLIACVVLIASTSAHYCLALRALQHLNVSYVVFINYICGLTCLVLSPFVFVMIKDNFNKEIVDTQVVYEIEDYVMIGVAIVGFTLMIVSKYWLVCFSCPETYCMFRHAKYLFASICQMIIQNMVNATIFSISGKVLSFIGMSICAFARLRMEYKTSDAQTKV